MGPQIEDVKACDVCQLIAGPKSRAVGLWSGLLCKGADIGCNILRFPPRQSHVHPGVRVKERECQDFRIIAEPPSDYIERKRISHLPALIWLNGMAGGATRLCQAFTVFSIGSEGR